MYEFEKDLFSCLNTIYKNSKLNDRIYTNELPLDYDFIKHKVGVYYTINNVTDSIYKNEVTVDVNFYCLEDDKVDMVKIISMFDAELNKKEFEHYWINHKNVWLIPIKEDDKYHYVLSYNVNDY